MQWRIKFLILGLAVVFGARIYTRTQALAFSGHANSMTQVEMVALLMDDRFSNGLPPSLSPHVGVYQGFKGMQIVHTSLVTAIRHWSAPSLIHTLPTEQYNQDIVSLGTHAALTAADITRLLHDAMAITL